MLDKKNFYINGEWIKPNSHEEITVVDPATEENCAVITLGNKIDIDMAVKAAKNAYESWAFSSKEDRIELLVTTKSVSIRSFKKAKELLVAILIL